MKPEWVIYKNGQRIGQAITWHKALDILIKQEKLNFLVLNSYSKAHFIKTTDQSNCYKILQER